MITSEMVTFVRKLLGYKCLHTKEAGLVQYRYTAEIHDCQSWGRKPQCCRETQKRGRSVMRWEESGTVLAFRQKMAADNAQAHYRRRSQRAEFCHPWIKSKPGLRQFHVGGLVKVQMEMLWACLTYNLQHWIRLRKLRPAPAGPLREKRTGRERRSDFRILATQPH
jgi:hypothetical protein